MKLKNRVALVTGAASGIGRAVAQHLAAEGAAVGVADIHRPGGEATVRSIDAAGGHAVFIACDVSQVTDCERMVAETVAAFGRLDIHVNNAAVMLEKNAPDTSEADWDRLIAINLKGTFFGAKYAILQFRRQGGGGSIVNMASVNSFFAEGNIAAYCTSKGGIAQMTRALAMDHSREGIRVNAICPGWIETPMNANFLALGPHIREQAARMSAIGRIGQPDDVARAVVFVVSDDAAFMTGSMVTVDGGFSAGLSPDLGIVI
jgi:NAD(P)-dependent dehydrogenase (short-subunit alcohol dehydrogenase family)